VALTLVSTVAGASRASGEGVGAGFPGAKQEPIVRLGRGDLWFGIAACAAAEGAAFADLEMRERALATDGRGARRLARGAEHLGSPEVVGPALLLTWAAGKAFDRPGLEGAGRRIGLPVAAAVAVTGALKVAVGRVRPRDVATESDRWQPFSGQASFPSGHAAIAFATATALDRETHAGWVPWVAYPLAGLVGWSRVRDDAHWTSDVVAGAALGAWTAAKTHDALRARERRAGRVGLRIDGGSGAIRAGVRLCY
jgi:hypothetical protein